MGHLENPEDYMLEILNKCKTKYVRRAYKLSEWKDHIDFLEQLAKRSGRLRKGGEPDINAASKMVLNDWTRGKLPYFTPPPGCMMEPRPDEEGDEADEDLDDTKVEEVEEDEELEDEEDEDPDNSDTETVATTDTTETTETVDSLFENVRFPKEEEEEFVKEKPAKPPIDLGELVKQDLRKIVTSVEYFDEEKFEGGKKIKSFHKKQKEAEQASKASDDKLNESTSDKNIEEGSEQTAETDSTSKPQEPEISTKRKSTESTEEISEKKVKTSSGTFSVSDK